MVMTTALEVANRIGKEDERINAVLAKVVTRGYRRALEDAEAAGITLATATQRCMLWVDVLHECAWRTRSQPRPQIEHPVEGFEDKASRPPVLCGADRRARALQYTLYVYVASRPAAYLAVLLLLFATYCTIENSRSAKPLV
jgi:hypothetical protein